MSVSHFPGIDQSFKGRIVPGHGCAFGLNPRCPYPGGSLNMQIPIFEALGVDFSSYFRGTINVDIAPQPFKLASADHRLRSINWTDKIPPEDFFFSRCRLDVAGRSVDALIYYPHHSTKVEHEQASTVAEILAPRIEGIKSGMECVLHLQSRHLDFASPLPQLDPGPFTLAFQLLRTGVPPLEPVTVLRQPAAEGHSLTLETMPDGGLRFTTQFRRQGHFTPEQCKGQVAKNEFLQKYQLPYWRGYIDPTAGSLSLCAPGYMVVTNRPLDIELRYDGIVLALYLDGVLVDEEWPYGELLSPISPLEWPGGAGITLADLQINTSSSSAPKHTEDRQKALELRAVELLGPQRPFGQYWHPRGHNTSAGDVMLCFDESRLHVLYLSDRRNHSSRWACGAHQFEHWSCTDLFQWEDHPPAYPLTLQEEAAVGTACMVYHENKYYVWGNVLSERLGAPASDVHPQGLYRAVSSDGVHFEKEPGPCLDACEPGIWFEKSTGIFHLIRSGQRMESRDLQSWRMADENFLPPPATINDASDLPTPECYGVIKWNDWFYIFGGRTGFWMARDIRGPFWPGAAGTAKVSLPRWDIYDGLTVPQCAVVWHNRCILCGWVVDRWWGGSIVFRELTQQVDGTLGLKWVEEMQPRHGTLRQLPCKTTDSSNSLNSDSKDFAWKSFDLPNGDFILKIKLKVTLGTKSFGLNLRGAGNYVGGAELRFEPSTRRVQWGYAGEGKLAVSASHPRCWASDCSIDNVEGMDCEVSVEIVVRGTILDACINGQRTFIARRHSLEGNNLFVFVEDGSISYTAPEAALLLP